MTEDPATLRARPRHAAGGPRPSRPVRPSRVGLQAEISVDLEAIGAPAPPVAPAPTAIELSRAVVGGIRAQDVHARTGVVGGMAPGARPSRWAWSAASPRAEASVSQGVVSAVLAQDVRIEQSLVRTVVANGSRPVRRRRSPSSSRARSTGNARILFDWRGALAFAAVFGALTAAFRLRGR